MRRGLSTLACVVLSIFCASCRSDRAWERSQIDQFSNHLTVVIQHSDVTEFVNLHPRQDDDALNVRTRKVLEIPKKEEDRRNPADIAKRFETSLQEIQARIGSVADAKCTRIEYQIDELPLTKKLGIFQFDITLTLAGNGTNVGVGLQGCILTARGILSDNDLTVH
jgi:hypothetical protein